MTLKAKYQEAVEKTLQLCCGTKKVSSILVACDYEGRATADLFYTAQLQGGKEAYLLQSTLPNLFTGRLSPFFHDALGKVKTGIIVSPELARTSFPAWLYELNNTEMICIATGQPRTLCRWMETDFKKVADQAKKIADLLTIGRELHITSPAGTDLALSIRRRSGITDFGRMLNGNGNNIWFLPTGEGTIEPEGRTARGRIVVEFLAGKYEERSQFEIVIKNGEVFRIRGKYPAAELLRKLFREQGAGARSLLHLGLGLNDAALFGRSLQEDIKARGAAHATFGKRTKSKSWPKFSPISAMILSPSLFIDGREILQGKTLLA